jgi:hypothetical protein
MAQNNARRTASTPAPVTVENDPALLTVDDIPLGVTIENFPIEVTSKYDLPVKAKFDASNLSAFGTLETAELFPVLQGDFTYGLNTQIWNTGVTSGTGATVDTNAARLRIQSGTSGTGYAYITTRKILRYRAGQGNVVRITPIFSTGAADNVQLIGVGYIDANAVVDGYFFGYNGAAFGICHYTGGSPVWYTQSADWNGDKVDGTAGTAFELDPTLGTPMMIKYPYLGYGDIMFFIQNPATAEWVLVHTIQYANTTASVQLSNPSLQILGFTENSGNTTNKTMYVGSIGVFISGMRNFASNPKWAADSAGMVTPGTGIKSMGTTESCLLNIRNCTTYNGVKNRGAIRLNSISVSASSNNSNLIVRLLIGSTYTTTPVFTPVSGNTVDNGVTLTGANSIASVDVAGTTITSIANRGTYLFNISICGNASQIIDLTPMELYVNPGEVLTVSGQGTASTNTTCSVNWSEDV